MMVQYFAVSTWTMVPSWMLVRAPMRM